MNVDVVASRKVTDQETAQILSKFLAKEKSKRDSLDTIVYVREHIIEQITRIRDNLSQNTPASSQ